MSVSAHTPAQTLPGRPLSPRVWLLAEAPGSVRPKTLPCLAAHASGGYVFPGAVPASSSRPHQEPISLEALEGSFAFLGSSSACSGSGDSWPGCSDSRKDGNPSHSLLQQPPGPKMSSVAQDHPLPLRALPQRQYFMTVDF